MKLNYALLPIDTNLRCLKRIISWHYLYLVSSWSAGLGTRLVSTVLYMLASFIYLIYQRRRWSLTIARGRRYPFANRCWSCVRIG